MIVTLLLVAILLHQIVATWLARRERKLLLLAALSRTPAEFQHLRLKGHDGTVET